jgi:glycosyltransferase involved in cell wall biosynthesis
MGNDPLMRIAIDGLPLTEDLTGIGYYTLELASHLAMANPEAEVQLVSPRAYLPALGESNQLPANLRCVRSRVNPIFRHWWSIGLPRYIRRHGIELFHGTNFEVPLQRVCPTVVTVHDLSMLLYPQTQEPKRVRRARQRLPLMTQAATMVITPTEVIRHEVHEYLQIPLDRIVAVPEAARSCFRRLEAAETRQTRERLGVRHEFLLVVGTVEPRKNLSNLLRAFEAILPLREKPLQLVIAGRKGWLVDDFFDSVRHSPAAENIIFAGYLADEDLCALYSSCQALVYPSIYEGFGLPPLEAMACGAPVVAGDIPAIREVVGAAARLVCTDGPIDLTRSLIELLDSESARAALSVAGLKRAAEFSWASTATTSKHVYAEASERFTLT